MLIGQIRTCDRCERVATGYVAQPPFNSLDAREPDFDLCDRCYWGWVNLTRIYFNLPVCPNAMKGL